MGRSTPLTNTEAEEHVGRESGRVENAGDPESWGLGREWQGRRERCVPLHRLLQWGFSSADAKSCCTASMAWDVLSTRSPLEALPGIPGRRCKTWLPKHVLGWTQGREKNHPGFKSIMRLKKQPGSRGICAVHDSVERGESGLCGRSFGRERPGPRWD